MIQLAVIPLVLAVWAAAIWAAERTTPPAPRIVARPCAALLTPPAPADPQPLDTFEAAAGPAAWDEIAGRPNTTCPRALTLDTVAVRFRYGPFDTPPPAVHIRQPAPTIARTVAEAWDHWEATRPRRLTLAPTHVTWHPGAPIHIEQAA